MKQVKIELIKPNPKNPRVIKGDKYLKLMNSIKEFPDMLNKRPLVVFTNKDGKYEVIGGNMRLKACKEVGMKEIPIILADEWSEEQKAEFIIKDNVGYGEWDWDNLANEWDSEKLDEWGLDVPAFGNVNYSDKNEEINIDDLDGSMVIKLNFSQADYWRVKKQLSKIASTPEQALLKLLGNE